MARDINTKVDALFVEGPDDAVLVNALVKRRLGLDISRPGKRLVQVNEEGGGSEWALRAFEQAVGEKRASARIGVVIDRDHPENDKWLAVRALLRRLGYPAGDDPAPEGFLVNGDVGIWMWPDNVSHGTVESFLRALLPASPLLGYADEVCRIAKTDHGAEYAPRHAAKAVLKVRSIWRDASAAAGYGHLVQKLDLVESSASSAFLEWFSRLYLT